VVKCVILCFVSTKITQYTIQSAKLKKYFCIIVANNVAYIG